MVIYETIYLLLYGIFTIVFQEKWRNHCIYFVLFTKNKYTMFLFIDRGWLVWHWACVN